jgi:excinuclease ABC subunit A
MANEKIIIRGAREHNLKNISLEIPKNKLIIITGLSGSGKSSLAINILYKEGQRRYLDSLPSYARQFLGNIEKAQVDEITGLSPAIAIDQKTVGKNIRSTVGTVTEIYDYLRVLFANIATLRCIHCLKNLSTSSPQELTQLLIQKYINNKIIIAAPLVIHEKGQFTELFINMIKKGFTRFLINNNRVVLKNEEDIQNLKLKKTEKHSIDLLLYQSMINQDNIAEIQESINQCYAYTQGKYCKILCNEEEELYSFQLMCISCKIGYKKLDARMFSFNSPLGACEKCKGIGVDFIYNINEIEDNELRENILKPCSSCCGERLNRYGRSAHINNKTIIDIANLDLNELKEWIFNLQKTFTPYQKKINDELCNELLKRISFLVDVGLPYMTLSRPSRTLSGGESQRIRLASQIGSGLSGVLYILDEPSIGLHQSDNDRLIKTLEKLRDQGNTVVVVEHDADTMKHADFIVDVGPQAGTKGGEIIFTGSYKDLLKNPISLTGKYLSGKLSLTKTIPQRPFKNWISIKNCNTNNLKNITAKFPLKTFCVISGISGSGKSTLIMQELYPKLILAISLLRRATFNATESTKTDYQLFKKDNLDGIENVKNVILIDQKPIGRTPRSNIATYLGFFDHIRSLYASLNESKALGYSQGTFSFNVGNGRCKECLGQGNIKINMHLLPDITVQCELCQGSGYGQDILRIKYNEKSIADILKLTVLEAFIFFEHHPLIAKKLKLLIDVGMDYVSLGQPSTTFSGGEAQRIKLADELSKRGENTIYILDEPTTGLHFEDIRKLLLVFDKLISKGNTVIVIEHNIDVIAYADYVIDIGPEGGKNGGFIVAEGIPDEIAKNPNSKTGIYLKKALQ